MSRKSLRCGSGYITDLCKLVKQGAFVEIVYRKIAGVNCKQYTIADKFRLIVSVGRGRRSQFFIGEYGCDWTNTNLPLHVCYFLSKLLDFREYVFYDELKNKSQEQELADSLGLPY